MLKVIIESPWKAPSEQKQKLHHAYLLEAISHSLSRGEAPFASHALYTLVLDDNDLNQRRLGMEAGWRWLEVADAVIVYIDLGYSPGMVAGVNRAKKLNMIIEERHLPISYLSRLPR